MSRVLEKQFQQATNMMFIPFIVAGDPTPEATVELALALEQSGATAIELGIPYSDPLADGPTIQNAAKRALSHKVTLESAMRLIPVMRKRGLKIPIIIFTYYNPVLQLGMDRFFALTGETGADGLLIPDLPFEESEALRLRCKKEGVAYISLVAPTSKQRIEKIASHAEGFLYCVSSLGVTGVRHTFDDKIYAFINEVKKYTNVPVAVGFGISSREQIIHLKEYCDGVVIGSALVKKIEELKDQLSSPSEREKAIETFKGYVHSIVSA